MAANANEETEIESSSDVILGSQQDQLAEALAEWRSSEQLENDTPSTSPPYWDTDDDDEDYDGGPKPSDLYGKYTWKIDKFSEIKKRELRSDAFEVGGYKWYILIYPQGCDVCNHLSLFLCVANYDQLMPGWSHFAQFTISAVNKDPKKSKYSDTLHRFWKKEHDWGWKKFMELPKLKEGFLDGDTLIIKAQVQIIREKADRPFRCLDCRYRRELLRAHLTSVEQTCRHFIEDRRSKLWKFLEDKETWFSFRKFWKSMDRDTRTCLSKEGVDVILKVLVKNFFVEKDAASTLVMDSLYSGLKALESHSKRKKLCDEEASPLIHVEDDTFSFADDVLRLIERSAMEPLPEKDDEGSLSGSNEDGFLEEFSREAIERDERRLTELGRRTIEAFIIAHIFNNKIKASYHEAVALKLQEELIREEELAEKRVPVEKEKKVKKKQTKQKRNSKKSKGKNEEPDWKQNIGKNFYLEEPNDLQNNAQDCYSEQPISRRIDAQGSYSEQNNIEQNNAQDSYLEEPIRKQSNAQESYVEDPDSIRNNGQDSYVEEPCDASDSELRKDASSPSSSMDSVHSQVLPFQTKGKSSARSETKPSNQYIKKSKMTSNGKLPRNLSGNVIGNFTNTPKKAAISVQKEKVVEKKTVERPVARAVVRPSSAPLSYKNAIVGNATPQAPPSSQSNWSSEPKPQFLNRQSVTDEFPHLDIINDLLDDEHCGSSSARCYERTRGYDEFSREYVPNSSSVWRAHSEGGQMSFFGTHYSSLSCGFSAYPFFRPSNGR